MWKQLISFTKVIKFLQHIELKGRFFTPTLPSLAYTLGQAIVKAISAAAANQKPFVNKDLCTRKSVKQTGWEPNTLLRLGNLKCQAVLVSS